MPVLNEGNSLGDGIKWEQDNKYSREKVTILSGSNIALLAVLGMVTASEKFVPLDPAASDGSQVAAGISILAVDATAADKEGVIINDDSMVAMDNLVWPDGITAGEKTTAIGQLAAMGIKPVGLA